MPTMVFAIPGKEDPRHDLLPAIHAPATEARAAKTTPNPVNDCPRLYRVSANRQCACNNHETHHLTDYGNADRGPLIGFSASLRFLQPIVYDSFPGTGYPLVVFGEGFRVRKRPNMRFGPQFKERFVAFGTLARYIRYRLNRVRIARRVQIRLRIPGITTHPYGNLGNGATRFRQSSPMACQSSANASWTSSWKNLQNFVWNALCVFQKNV